MGEANDTRLARAIAAFDAANGRDPTRVVVDGVAQPKELVQARRLSQWVERLRPQPSEALRLAARCQHLCRWEIPRASYEPGRMGYLRWRKDLSRFHADRAAEILKSVGYDEETIEQVRRINLKRGLKVDAEVQTIEDALCLSFIEHELEEFASRHPEDKVIDILRKSWAKMSQRGQAAALDLSLTERLGVMVQRALEPE